MVFINCPLCGQRLLEGDEGSHVQIKCTKCGNVAKVKIGHENISIENKVKTIKESC